MKSLFNVVDLDSGDRSSDFILEPIAHNLAR